MKIIQFRGDYTNFGDELNSWLWPKLMPGFFNEDPSEVFIGIGSTIGMTPSDAAKKIVFGAGFVPSYHAKPDVSGDDWRIYFVRGPRTAQRLNLDPSLAISDSGILASTCIDRSGYAPSVVSFMPHWESMERGNWEQVCAQAGINLIDPRLPVHSIIKQLLRTKLIICEAMHGAIIADCLRIPWVSVAPLNPAHREKWYDWSESLDIHLQPELLLPSGMGEFSKANFSRSPLPVADTIHGHASETGDASSGTNFNVLNLVKRITMLTPWAPLMNTAFVDLAARRLVKLSKMSGQLSTDIAMERAKMRMLEKLDLFQRDYGYARYDFAAMRYRIAA